MKTGAKCPAAGGVYHQYKRNDRGDSLYELPVYFEKIGKNLQTL